MADTKKILEDYKKSIGKLSLNLNVSFGEIKGIQDLISKELNPDQEEIMAQFHKDAATLPKGDSNSLMKLRDMYKEKLKNA